ncbi:MAG TPA: LLM class flavin-dependent oxidoreductase [Candidatus Limnocylindria bacterium]|nr:LLM class flavin-dependent oxidoreductase [Candidatus Limnocylindria bacterium]
MTDASAGLPRDRPLFGMSITPTAVDHPRLIQQVLAAERGGLDLVGIQDHPYQRRFLDTFSLIADLAARTERIRFFPDVANLPLRGPTMIAKAAASMDVMSGGRFELGIGAGTFWDAVAGMGGPRRSAGDSITALEEAVRIIRAVLDGERVVRGEGEFYPVSGYPPGPPPAHRVEIWIGAYRRRGLDLIARMADGWVPSLGYLPPSRFGAAASRLDAAAARAGRNPRDIRRIYNLTGRITQGELGDGPLVGPVELWVERLSEWYLDLGVDTFIFWPADAETRDVEIFARQIVPAVLEATAREAGT